MKPTGARARRIAARQGMGPPPMSRGTPLGARFAPLSDTDVERIHRAALEILSTIGMASPTRAARDLALAAGCGETATGRLTFPPALIEDMLAVAARSFTCNGRDPALDFEARNDKVNFCTGGAAVKMLDPDTREYRPSTLADLYDLARLADALPNLQWFARPVVATEIEDLFALDANTVYACAAGTRKHIASSFCNGDHVRRIAPMLDALAGGDGAFARRPFLTIHATTIV